MNILVFKTNIRYKKNLHTLVPYLENNVEINKWNVDFHDKDKILRIESDTLSPQHIENAVVSAGYYCEELKD